MNGFNRVVLMGNLTRDPELKTLASGSTVVDMGLATNESYKNREGVVTERTCYVDIVAWGRQAELCGQYLSKGAAVLVEGRLQFDRWEDGDGRARSKLRVRANSVQFISTRRTESTASRVDVNRGESDVTPEKAAAALEVEADAMPF